MLPATCHFADMESHDSVATRTKNPEGLGHRRVDLIRVRDSKTEAGRWELIEDPSEFLRRSPGSFAVSMFSMHRRAARQPVRPCRSPRAARGWRCLSPELVHAILSSCRRSWSLKDFASFSSAMKDLSRRRFTWSKGTATRSCGCGTRPNWRILKA